MTSELCALGPPGTGKTTLGVGLAEGWYARGAAPADVAYLAFTKSAARQAASRIADETLSADGFKQEFPLFRTIHSLCYRGLRFERKEPRVMTSSDWKRFSEKTGIRGSFEASNWEDLADVYLSIGDQRTEWDQVKSAYTLSRLTARTEAELDKARKEPSRAAIVLMRDMIDTTAYRSFVKVYEDFKEKEGLIDFTDMLEYGLRRMTPLNTKYVIVDECQDLCPLHFAIIERLFEDSELLVRIGDDDQTIFHWSGASAAQFLSYARRSKQIVLRQTHRFGDSVVAFSKKIIRRVRDRIDKNVIGLKDRAGDILLESQWTPAAGHYFILHRHVAGCQAVANQFIMAGMPFRNERGKSPLNAANKVRAFQQIEPLAKGAKLPFSQIRPLIEELLPSTCAVGDVGKMRLVVHGAKKRLEKFGMMEMSLPGLIKNKILTEDGARVVRERKYDVMKHSEYLEYYHRVIKNGYALRSSDGPTITTIHGSKGRQAPHVVVYTEMGRRCWDDPDSEHRLAYVAATRTQNSVTFVADNTTEWMHEQYPYPINGR